MDPSSSWQLFILIIVILLVIASAIISVAEVSFANVSKGRLRNMVEDNVKNAKKLSDLLEKGNLFDVLTIGNSFFNVSATVLGAYLLHINLDINNIWLKLFLSILIMTFMILVFGEIIPETIARKAPEKTSLRYVSMAKFFHVTLRPFVILCFGFSNVVLRLFGFKMDKEPSITMEELKNIVDVSVEEGVLDQQEKELIDNVTEFGELRVEDVMTQRTDMIAVSDDITLDELKKIILEERYSRIPVYRESIDDIVGVLNVKDLMFMDESKDFKVTDYMREPFFTYEFKSVQDLFLEMRKDRSHIAVVLDEYGGTVGLVTIEDFLEEIVGDIDDEFDDEEEVEFKKISENHYYAEGSYKLDDLNEELGLKIESEEVDTIGGFIIALLGNFPVNNQTVEYENLKFVVSFAKNRITGVNIYVDENKNNENIENNS